MSRRSLQRKAWHLIYKSLPPVRRPGLEPATWQEGLLGGSPKEKHGKVVSS